MKPFGWKRIDQRGLPRTEVNIHSDTYHSGILDMIILPPELNAVADEVHVHFPWGSLLRAVATGDVAVLQKLRRICAPGALLEVVIGLDPARDQTEIDRLGLTPLSIDFLDNQLAANYQAAGFETIERGIIAASEWPEFNTSWAKRLHGNEQRNITYLIARAI